MTRGAFFSFLEIFVKYSEKTQSFFRYDYIVMFSFKRMKGDNRNIKPNFSLIQFVSESLQGNMHAAKSLFMMPRTTYFGALSLPLTQELPHTQNVL